MRSRCEISAAAIARMTSPRRVLPMRSARIVYIWLAWTSPRHAWRRRSTASPCAVPCATGKGYRLDGIGRPLCRPGLADHDTNSLDRVVHHPLGVSVLLDRLGVCFGIGGSHPQLALAGTRRVPLEGPAAPRERRGGRLEGRFGPGGTPVIADLHVQQGRQPGPRTTLEQ